MIVYCSGDLEPVAHLLGLPRGVLVLLGDLPADHDVVGVDIGDREESPFLERVGIHGALEAAVGGDVLTLDDRGVQEALDLLFLGLHHEFERVARDQADVLDGRRQAPDLGSDHPHAGHGAELLGHAGRELAEDGGGHILAEDHHPLDLVEGVADEVPKAVGDAEEPEDA